MRLIRGSQAREFWFHEGCLITEWSNSDHDPGLSIARARLPAGTTTRWHKLDGITERYVILAGRGRAAIGRESFEVAPGDVVVIAPGERQRITAIGPEELEFLALCTPRFSPNAYIDLDTEQE